MPEEILSVPSLLRKMKKLDDRIAANLAQIKKDRADKTKLNKVIALVEQMYPDEVPTNVTSIRKVKCKVAGCGDTFTSAKGLGVHVRMKHEGGAAKAQKALVAAKKRAASGR